MQRILEAGCRDSADGADELRSTSGRVTADRSREKRLAVRCGLRAICSSKRGCSQEYGARSHACAHTKLSHPVMMPPAALEGGHAEKLTQPSFRKSFCQLSSVVPYCVGIAADRAMHASYR